MPSAIAEIKHFTAAPAFLLLIRSLPTVYYSVSADWSKKFIHENSFHYQAQLSWHDHLASGRVRGGGANRRIRSEKCIHFHVSAGTGAFKNWTSFLTDRCSAQRQRASTRTTRTTVDDGDNCWINHNVKTATCLHNFFRPKYNTWYSVQTHKTQTKPRSSLFRTSVPFCCSPDFTLLGCWICNFLCLSAFRFLYVFPLLDFFVFFPFAYPTILFDFWFHLQVQSNPLANCALWGAARCKFSRF